MTGRTAGLLSVLDVRGAFFTATELLALCCVSAGTRIALHSHVCWLATDAAVAVYGDRAPLEQAGASAVAAELVPARAARVHAIAAARLGVRRAWAAVDAFHRFRLSSALGVSWSGSLPDWNGPLGQGEIHALHEALGAIHLPPAFLASLLLRNGQPRDAPLHARLYGARLLSSAELSDAYTSWRMFLLPGGLSAPVSASSSGATMPAFAVHGKPAGLYMDPRYLLPVSDVFEGGKRLAVDLLVTMGPVYVLDGLASATYVARDWEAFLWGTVA